MRYVTFIASLCLISVLTGCKENKQNAHNGFDLSINKPYTEDKNGDAIFYSLKKPAQLDSQIQNDSENNLKKITAYLKQDLLKKTTLFKDLTLEKKNKSLRVLINLIDLHSFDENYVVELKQNLATIFNSIIKINSFEIKEVVIVQNFKDGTLTLTINDRNLKKINKGTTNILDNSNLSEGFQSKLKHQICANDTFYFENRVKFCNETYNKDNNSTSVSVTSINGRNTVSEDEKSQVEDHASNFSKNEKSLTEEQKKILQDAGFDIFIN